MRHGSLFSGIGGFDLAAEWMGWKNVFHCEWNEFGKNLLHYYWPNADSLNDITKTDFTKYANKIDILTGGFPCQPYSSAGKRLGKEDERHLWPEMLRAIREIGPKYVVGENVFGLLSWNGGVVFDEVHSDLEAAGYEVQAVVIPAAAVNAPHGRDRVWFVAKNTMRSRCAHGELEQERAGLGEQRNSSAGSRDGICLQARNDSNTNRDGFNGCDKQNEIKPSKRRVDALGDAELLGRFASNPTSERGKWVVARKQRKIGDPKQIKFRRGDCQSVIANTKRVRRGEIFENIQPKEPNGQLIVCDGGFGVTTDTNSIGQKPRFSDTEREFSAPYGFESFNRPNDWSQFPTQSPVCGGDDGISDKLDSLAVFDGIGKPRKPITFSKWRQEAVKAYGNAIVPQVALQIFKAIIDTEK